MTSGHPGKTAAANAKRRTAARKKGAWKQPFLDAFRENGCVRHAAAQVGIDRRTVQRACQADEQFALAFYDAGEDAADNLEREAHRRGVEGVEKPVTVAGKREVIREFSDTLLIVLLKARRPERFRERYEIKHAIPTDQVAKLATAMSEIAMSSDPPDVRAERTDRLLAELAGEGQT